MLFELQDKLAYKEFLAAKLYYNLGLYLGNNYESCIITAQNALKDYPFTKHKEDLTFLILRAKAEMADLSAPRSCRSVSATSSTPTMPTSMTSPTGRTRSRHRRSSTA